MVRSDPMVIGGDDQAEPQPIRVEVIDLEEGLPTLLPDGRYRRAWVVARRGGIPRAIVEVDLESPDEALDHLRRLAEDAPANLSESDAPEDAGLPSISVVVPSIIARVEELDLCLAAFADLDYPDFEIILVDNRRELPQDDPLPALLADRPQIRSVRAVRPGISAARNAGIEAARGDIVIFTDDDVHVDANWLRAFGRRFRAQPSLDAVTGLILPAELESPAQVYFERYYGGFSGERTFEPLTLRAGRGPLGRARVTAYNAGGDAVRRFAIYGVGAYGAGANMAFRRSTLQRVGGFDVALGTGTPARGGEDLATLIDVLWRGGEVGYEPAAVVYHKHREDYPALLHQMHGNGVGFTAMLSSLISHDPAHLLGLAAQLPLAGQRMATQSLTRLKGQKVTRGSAPAAPQEPLYPRAMVQRELRGLTQGVPAYVRSRRRSGAWRASQGQDEATATGDAAATESRTPLPLQQIQMAGAHLWFNVIGGSALLPGSVRQLIYRRSGAQMKSAPGGGFILGGSARNLRVEENVYFNLNVYVECRAPVSIGRDTSVGMEAMILTSHHPVDDQGRWALEPTGRPVSIGRRVWIGARALILPGAVVEDDVIVAAGAVVAGRCTSHGVYAGVPARRIREFTADD